MGSGTGMKAKVLSRREQVQRAGSTVFIVVAIAAVIVMFSVISMRFLWDKKSYNDRVITAKTQARNDIRTNLDSLEKLSEQFPELEKSATTNSKTILHALPPTYDYAALASSLDLLASISGVTSNSSPGDDLSATAVASAPTSTPIEIPLNLQVAGSYAAISQYIVNLERSIRPMHISSVTFTGSNASIEASIQAKTYYQPSRSLDVQRSPIQ